MNIKPIDTIGFSRRIEFLSGDLLVKDNRSNAARLKEPVDRKQEILYYARSHGIPHDSSVEQLTLENDKVIVKYNDGKIEEIAV